ncbi:phosphohydrolase [Oceanobacillus picturae]|jgi:predicted HD superfamily hydrolase involved in NAD metabolism|uniref:bis(5'-nucleosyl)-tetraphosphatase (symmetrical) n=1 Tax=Oceanobacillus picturae TaxID=171693 RepID=W9A7R7_9BACI|nr:bis(5'-nucleosyl)-tetraphosphatase (symmetrical) YqeK [Oceanobacillus picturae]GAQ19343.1 phosphohydrolase [Oceanobacillus picturae]CDO01829.1 putative nicotinate-nucleotide adenylyltransferase [Oceanobacillus picturae]
MEIRKAKELVEPHLTEARFDHSLRVAETARYLADLYGGSKEKAELAGILHDYAKYRPLEEMEQQIKAFNLPNDLLDFHSELWHAPIGAILVEEECGLKDEDIKGAIKYHTTGRANMTKLEKIIFLADYIEPGRSFPGIEEVRESAKTNLEHACWLAVRNTIQYLIRKNAKIYPDTFHAYNDLSSHINGGNE